MVQTETLKMMQGAPAQERFLEKSQLSTPPYIGVFQPTHRSSFPQLVGV